MQVSGSKPARRKADPSVCQAAEPPDAEVFDLTKWRDDLAAEAGIVQDADSTCRAVA